MSDYKALSVKELADRITDAEDPRIIIHRRPDGDTLGTAMALSVIFSLLGKEAKILSKDKIPKRLEFILENSPSQLITEADGGYYVCVDVASPEQLGEFSYLADEISIMIDHHEIGKIFADSYIIPGASSAAEVLFDLVRELISRKKISLTKELAKALYTAISSDTGCFRYSNTSPKTLNIAAELIERGIDFADINHRLFNSKTKEEITAEGFVSSSLVSAFDGRVAYVVIKREDMARLSLSDEHFETAVDVARSLSGVEIAIAIKEQKDSSYRASLRSTGLNVASVAHKFGGGGHIRAAGCSLLGMTDREAVEALLSEIKSVISE